MKIKMKTLYASPVKIVQADGVSDFSDSEGKALIDGRFGISLEPIKNNEVPVAVHPAETIINPVEKQKLIKEITDPAGRWRTDVIEKKAKALNKPKKVKK